MEDLDKDIHNFDIGNSESDESLMQWPEHLYDLYHENNQIEVDLSSKDQELSPNQILKKYWGYDDFRPLQKDIIDSILEGNDTMGLMPTGGGKSISFQVPALKMKGISLVVTPLISLMKDQVDNLLHRKIKAAAIHSGMSSEATGKVLDNLQFGNYKFLYCSPERLSSKVFLDRIRSLDISLIVVDECHCISQWGYDFRPSYLNILDIRAYFSNAPILALTATATVEVREDIKRILGFGKNSKTFVKSFFRENLSYSIRRSESRDEMMMYILSKVKGSAIVYCRNRELTKNISKAINEAGDTATFFHAGLSAKEREMRQERWMKGEVRIMVATNAFGMGIDKPDVRLVIHYNMPSTLEEYYQEAGRAGRDGKKAYAVALIDSRSVSLLKRRVNDSFPERSYILQVYEEINNFLHIAEGEGMDRSYSFDFDLFLVKHRMRPVQTRSAISILEAAGVLEYREDNNMSRLTILMNRDSLYDEGVGYDLMLRTLMRKYPGLFSDYVFISESEIAYITSMSQEEVYLILKSMSSRGIIHYIPKNNLPRIVFRIRREDAKYLYIPRKVYEDRKERLETRISSVINYIEENDTCRSKLLLEYFGENDSVNCNFCDNCLAPKSIKSKNNQELVKSILAFIRQKLIEENLEYIDIKDISNQINSDIDSISEAINTILYYDKSFILEANLIKKNFQNKD